MSLRYIIPFLFTLSAMLAGFYSIVACATGNYLVAAQLIMLSMILDGLDGNLARLLKGSSQFGAELDTYVDMMSFGIAPALLAYLAVLRDFGFLGMLLASSMVLSGLVRLSRFRIIDPYRGQRGYQGLPITINACWISMFIFIAQSGVLNREWASLQGGLLAALVWSCSVMFIVLQVSNIRYPKPTKGLLGMIPCVIFVMCLFAKVQLAVASAISMCLTCFVYAFITPLFPKQAAIVEDLDEAEEEEEPVTFRHP